MKTYQEKLNEKLLDAVFINSIDDVNKYIQDGANVDYLNYKGVSPLIEASNNGQLDIVKILVEHGANINIENDSSLIYSAIFGHLDIVKYFILEKGQNLDYVINEVDVEKNVYQWAIQYKSSLILKNHLDINLAEPTIINKKNKI